MLVRVGRVIAAVAALAVAAMVLTACSSSVVASRGSADGVVKIEGSITGADAALLVKSWSSWEKANHIRIEYTGNSNFQEQIGGEAQQGNAPDLGIFPQPGLIRDLATRGYIQKLAGRVAANVKANFSSQWAGYASVNGTEYAAPLLVTLNGWVFYSPHQFASLGLKVPTTWDQLLAVTRTIATKTGHPSWCEGFSAGAESGAAGAGWIADLVLRDDGPKVYDQWVNHQIDFRDPRIAAAFDKAGTILLDASLTNAGIGGPSTINSTSTADVAAAVKSGKCALTRQTSAFVGNLSSGADPATVSPTGDFWAFMLPGTTSSLTPVTGGGEFVAAFSNDADTVKVQQYLSSTAWANSRVSLGGAASPDVNVSPGEPGSLLDQQSTVILEQFGRVFRFDASGLMPSIVGSGTFLTGMVDWANNAPESTFADAIDDSWPKGG